MVCLGFFFTLVALQKQIRISCDSGNGLEMLVLVSLTTESLRAMSGRRSPSRSLAGTVSIVRECKRDKSRNASENSSLRRMSLEK